MDAPTIPARDAQVYRLTMTPLVYASRYQRARLLAVSAAVSCALSAAAAVPWRAPVAQSLVRGFAAEPLASDALRPAERTFLEKAGAMSRDHLRLVRLAVSQATATEVRDLALQMAVDHRALTNAVADLQRRKGAPATPTEPLPEVTSEVYQRLAQQAGAEFDRAFVRVLGEAHTEMMTMFEQAAADAKDTDVRALTGAFLPTLREHQNRLTELRKTLE